MRRSARMLTGTALAVAAAGLAAAPAYAGDGTVTAARPPAAGLNTPVALGAPAALGVPAALGAPAGSVALAAVGNTTTGLEVYPATAVPGDQVSVNTKSCGQEGSAIGDSSAVGAGTFPLAPSAHEGDAIGQFRVPPSAQPGTYEIVVTCAEGGHRVTGDLMVALAAAHDQVQPHGSVKTGVGGALGPGPVQTTAGVAALAVAAAGGTWLLHRRARGDGI